MSDSVQRTKTYAICPTCHEDAGEIDHLLNKRMSTYWYCESCGQEYSLDFPGDGTVTVAALQGRKITTSALLVLKPQTKPVYFVVPGMRFEGTRMGADQTPEERKESARFFYESHSCPTNWFRPEVVYFDGDDDPHGLIEFVAERDADSFPPDESVSPNDHDRAMVEFIEASHVG